MSRISWFPGHMRKAARMIEEKLKIADAVIEVRDARIPISSINPTFNELVKKYNRPRLVVINKSDLISPSDRKWAMEQICKQEQIENVIFTSAKTSKRKIVGKIKKALVQNTRLKNSKRYQFKHSGTMAMVVGMPNVGKSSIINLMRTSMVRGPKSVGGERSTKSTKKRRTHVAKTGAKPGLTRHIAPIQITNDPNIFLFDTPGVMIPRIESDDVGFKLALANVLPEKIVPKELLVEHLLEIMNNLPAKRKNGNDKSNLYYTSALKLPNNEPMYDVNELLYKVGMSIGRHPDSAAGYSDAATFVLNKFNKGSFGKFLLEDMGKHKPTGPLSSE